MTFSKTLAVSVIKNAHFFNQAKITITVHFVCINY